MGDTAYKITLKVTNRKAARNPAVKRWIKKVEHILTLRMNQKYPDLFKQW